MPESLEINELAVSYGKLEAVRKASLSVTPGRMVAVVGPNGAGKSTTLLALAGVLMPVRGQIRIDGEDVTRWSPENRAARRLSFVPENRGVFRTLTVQENLRLGSSRQARRHQGMSVGDVEGLFPVLAERARQPAGLLSGGEQQQLAIARALVTRPRYIVIDEPSLGLAPLVVKAVYDALRRIRDELGIGIVVVEQNLRRVRKYADQVIVMRAGETRSTFELSEDTDDERVEREYFGRD